MNIKSKVLFVFALFFCFVNISIKAQSLAWEKLYGLGYGNESSRIDDETFYVCGSGPAGHPAVVMKLNQYGNQIWYREFDNTYTSYANCIVTTDDKGCVIIGNIQSHKAIWKYDTDGNLLWLKNFDGGDDLEKIIKVGASFYAVGGNIVFKFDSNGNLIWTKGFTINARLFIHDIYFEKNSNTLFCAGDFLDQYPVTLGFIGKIDASGNITGQRTYKLLEKTTWYSYLKRYGNGFIVAGITVDSNSFNPRVFFQKINMNCDIEFTKIFPQDSNEWLSGFFVKDDNKLMFSTRSGDANQQQQNKMKFFVTDGDGNITKSNIINSDYTKYINFGMMLNNGYSIFTGYKGNTYYATEFKILVIKLDSSLNFSTVNVSESSSSIAENFSLSQNYPNPFNPNTIINYQIKNSALISLNIYDANGRLIKILENGFKPAGNYTANFSAEGLSSGVYYYSLVVDGVVFDTKKAVILK
ncbi:MAG: T9SS type A sorting domain-containing protein [Bacteroidetes bacterium]|nr:T9SS type A sorting domain-containing protein [Bacteroidota bacterium]